MAIESTFNPTWLTGIPGAFVSYGSGADIDMAFDDAALADRFEYGTSGLLPSLADVDPVAPRVDHTDPMHRHAAWRAAMTLLADAEPGTLHAFAVAPFKVYKHRVAAVTVTDPDVPAPLTAGGLWNAEPLLTAAVSLVELADGEEAVSGEQARIGTVRYKAAAAAVPGPKVTAYAVVAAGTFEPISVHPTMPAARKAALLLARDKTAGPLRLEVRPVVTKADGVPLVTVTRTVVACKRPVKVLVASVKNPEKPLTTDGWVFAGRR